MVPGAAFDGSSKFAYSDRPDLTGGEGSLAMSWSAVCCEGQLEGGKFRNLALAVSSGLEESRVTTISSSSSRASFSRSPGPGLESR